MPSRRQRRQTEPVYRAIVPDLDPAPLGGAAAVVRDGRDVSDRGHLESGGLERADRLLPTSPWALDVDLDLAHPVLHRAAGGTFGRERRSVRRALAGALEADDAGRAPADHGPTEVGDRDDRVVERRLDVNVTLGHVLALLATLLDGTLAVGHGRAGFPLLLPADADRLLRSAPLACVRLGPLAACRQVAPMATPAVRADLDQTLDVQGDFAAQVAFDLVAPVDDLAQPVDLLLGEVADPGVGIDVGLGEDLLAGRQAEAEDIGEGDLHPLLARDINAGNARHRLPLPLLVLGIGADDHHGAVAANHLAVVATRLDGGSNFQRFLDRTQRQNNYFRR